jgi:hypothetical protein
MEAINLEWRMYGLVPYNLSEIQKGIQFGHAVVEYANKFGQTEEYKRWSKQDKTFIILNGGTTNDTKVDNGVPHGTLNQHIDSIMLQGINYAKFREPDLQNAVTAVVFLVNERVWDREKYPDFEYHKYEGTDYETRYASWFKIYQEKIGASGDEMKKIIWLRNFLKQFKLA